MEFKHIEYFVETAKHKSISKAAENLFISQQALSRCMKNLEAELSCNLFERTVKGSVLTEEGELLYHKFSPIVERFRHTEDEVFAALSNRPQTLSFACAPFIFRILDTELLFEFEELYPNITLNRMEMPDMDIDDYIKEDSKHFALLALPENRHGMRFKHLPVLTVPLCLYVHKDDPLAQVEKVNFAQLHRKNLLMVEKKSHYHHMIEDFSGRYGVTPKKSFESSDVMQLYDLVNRGKGVFISPENSGAKMLFQNIRVIPFDDETLTYSIAFIFKDYDRLSPTVKKFMQHIIDNAKA